MKYLATAMIVSAMGSSLAAQWLHYPTPGIPRTPDGKPNLSAPVPKLANGKPDLSGIWQISGLGSAFNIMGDLKPEEIQPWAQALYKQRMESYGKNAPGVRCLPSGPRAGLFSQALLKMIHTPNLLAILYEEDPARQIFTDGRPLPEDPDPTWMGYSVGRWDKDTLVVDTAGYNDKTWLDIAGHPHTEALHVTQRYQRKDFGHMQLEMTFEDPKAYTRPWTISMAMNLMPDTEILETVCENERDSDHLVGTIQDDRKKEVKVSREILAKYVGTYNAGPLGNMKVFLDGDQLSIELPGGGGKQAIFAESETSFHFPTVGGGIEFVMDARGAVTSLTMQTVEGKFPARRTSGSTQ